MQHLEEQNKKKPKYGLIAMFELARSTLCVVCGGLEGCNALPCHLVANACQPGI
jgi:hypothetical protein